MTKVLFDTNILVSTILHNSGVPSQAYRKAVELPYQGMICEQTFEELRRVFSRKFPNKIYLLEKFIAAALPVVDVISVPLSKHPDEDEIRDIDDRPILRAAIKAGADIILTGDNDFLESAITHPKIMRAAQFVQAES